MDSSWRSQAACSPDSGLDLLTDEEKANLTESAYIANIRKIQTLFFPEKGNTDSVNAAVDICNTCPVQEECLRYSLDTSQKIGIWGGTSGRTRRRVTRMRKIYHLSGKMEPE